MLISCDMFILCQISYCISCKGEPVFGAKNINIPPPPSLLPSFPPFLPPSSFFSILVFSNGVGNWRPTMSGAHAL